MNPATRVLKSLAANASAAESRDAVYTVGFLVSQAVNSSVRAVLVDPGSVRVPDSVRQREREREGLSVVLAVASVSFVKLPFLCGGLVVGVCWCTLSSALD